MRNRDIAVGLQVRCARTANFWSQDQRLVKLSYTRTEQAGE
jgi:hypothetical protein